MDELRGLQDPRPPCASRSVFLSTSAFQAQPKFARLAYDDLSSSCERIPTFNLQQFCDLMCLLSSSWFGSLRGRVHGGAPTGRNFCVNCPSLSEEFEKNLPEVVLWLSRDGSKWEDAVPCLLVC